VKLESGSARRGSAIYPNSAVWRFGGGVTLEGRWGMNSTISLVIAVLVIILLVILILQFV
jgi:uncharacterized membrane protein